MCYSLLLAKMARSLLTVRKGLKSSFHWRKMFSLDIFLTNWLDFTKTIIPLALMAPESIAHLAFGLMGY